MTTRQLDGLLLSLLLLCGCTTRHVSRNTPEEVLVSAYSVADVAPVELSKQDFHQALQELALDFRPSADPRKAAAQLFKDSLENLRGEVTIIEGPVLDPETPQHLARDYLQWCTRAQTPGDCLGLLNDDSSPNEILGVEKHVLTIAIALEGVLQEAAWSLGSALKETITPQAILETLLWSMTTYMLLWIIPEPISKGVAATMTVVLMAYTGVKTLWNIISGWKQLTAQLNQASTFASVQAAASQFSRIIGQGAARILIMVVAAATGGAASKLISKIRKMRGFSEASRSARTQGSAAPDAEVKSVSVSPDGTFRISQPAAPNTAKAVISKVVATASNYRDLFTQNRPDLPKDWPVHHSLPQRYEELMRKVGINVHEVQYLRGVDSDTHKLITKEWNNFHRTHGKSPTVDQIISFAKQIDQKYGQSFMWPKP